MSLKWYGRPRLVVLKPETPVLDAAGVSNESHSSKFFKNTPTE
jgi:hypothetical protein